MTCVLLLKRDLTPISIHRDSVSTHSLKFRKHLLNILSVHPGKENGVIYYHQRVKGGRSFPISSDNISSFILKEICSDHLKLEKEVGREVYPARPGSQDTETTGCVNNGACSGNQDGDITLNW